MAALLISSLVLIVVGPQIGGAIASAVGLGAVFQVVWNIVRFPILLGVVLFAFALVYYFAPNVDQRFRWVSPGSWETALSEATGRLTRRSVVTNRSSIIESTIAVVPSLR